MAVEYEKRRGHRDFIPGIIADFMVRWPRALPPSSKTIKRQAEHLEHFSTLHNLNSKVAFHDFKLFSINSLLIFFKCNDID